MRAVLMFLQHNAATGGPSTHLAAPGAQQRLPAAGERHLAPECLMAAGPAGLRSRPFIMA